MAHAEEKRKAGAIIRLKTTTRKRGEKKKKGIRLEKNRAGTVGRESTGEFIVRGGTGLGGIWRSHQLWERSREKLVRGRGGGERGRLLLVGSQNYQGSRRDKPNQGFEKTKRG